MKKTLLVSLTFGLLLSGCNDEDSLGTSEGTGVRFTSYMVESRATDTAWEAGDEIGVYMQADAASGYQKINVKYANSDGNLNTFTSETPIEYSGNESTVNFMAVYPFSASVTSGNYTFTLGNEGLSKNDIMYASTTSVEAGTQNVTLEFKHKLTKIVLQLKDENGNSVTGASITIDKQRVNGTLDVATGNVSATEDYTSTLQFAGSDGTYEAIVIPDEGHEGRSVLIEANGKKYSYPVGDIAFNGATKYTFPVSLRPAEPGEEEEGGETIIKLDAVEFSIDDWTEGKTIGWIISTDAEISTERYDLKNNRCLQHRIHPDGCRPDRCHIDYLPTQRCRKPGCPADLHTARRFGERTIALCRRRIHRRFQRFVHRCLDAGCRIGIQRKRTRRG